MSDSFIDVIPADPAFVPAEAARGAGVALARRLFPRAEAVAIEVNEHIVFRDCGGNFESVTCPVCGADLMEAWGALMGEDFDGDGFALRPHELECCGTTVTLNDLAYELPQGFSRTVLRVSNPDVADVPESTLRALESEIGCAVRAIHRHL